jgi:hypothetical protein
VVNLAEGRQDARVPRGCVLKWSALSEVPVIYQCIVSWETIMDVVQVPGEWPDSLWGDLKNILGTIYQIVLQCGKWELRLCLNQVESHE